MKKFSCSILVMMLAVSAFPGVSMGAADYGTELPVIWSSAPGKMGLWRTAWSPDGKWIAVTVQAGNARDILVVPSQGGAPKNLTGDITETCAIPQFTSDSEEIAFTHYAVDENKMMIPVFEAIDISTGDRRKLAEGFGGALSRDGKQAVYQALSTSTSPMALIVENLEDGSTKSLISNSPKIVIDFGHSCFDPTGKNIVTTLIVNGAPELSSHKLFKLPVSGGDSLRVSTDDAAEEWYPEYSPLGTRVMYTRYVYGKDRNDVTTQVYIFDTAAGKTAPLIPDAGQSTWCGCWSPDGRKVCYVVETDAGSRLYVKSVQPEDSNQLGVAAKKPGGFE
ncbi:MAG: TolB family protein, partial [Candidatus Latescibacterota bacterium]